MKLELIEKLEDGKRIADLSLLTTEVKIGSSFKRNSVFFDEYKDGGLEIPNIIHLARGRDSDVYQIGDDILKVYCRMGSIRQGTDVSIRTLQRYRKLTKAVKQFLEQNPPERFQRYSDNGNGFDVSYRVIPVKQIFHDISESLKNHIMGYFGNYALGSNIRHVWNPDLAVTASSQDFVPGPHFADSKNYIKKRGLSTRGLNKFFSHLWRTFPGYDRKSPDNFEMDLQNIKLNFGENTLEVIITDLAAIVGR